jgi:drug/metabolite transporter (DMT)-like permease
MPLAMATEEAGTLHTPASQAVQASSQAPALHWLSLAALVLVTLIWGTTFPITKNAVATIEPSTLITARFWVAALVFLPFLGALWRKPAPNTSSSNTGAGFGLNSQLALDGLWLGAVLFASYITQVLGLTTVSSNRAAFITGLNVVLVPLFSPFLGRFIPKQAWWAAALAMIGIGALSFEGGSLGIGDFWVLLCAISYAAYILLLDNASKRHSPLALTAVQLLVVALLGSVWALPRLDGAAWANIVAVWPTIVYLGVVATALATFIQAFAQRSVSAVQTAIVYALEPVFAAVFAYFWLHETLGWRGFVGAGLVLLAMILSQWPERAPNTAVSTKD